MREVTRAPTDQIRICDLESGLFNSGAHPNATEKHPASSAVPVALVSQQTSMVGPNSQGYLKTANKGQGQATQTSNRSWLWSQPVRGMLTAKGPARLVQDWHHLAQRWSPLVPTHKEGQDHSFSRPRRPTRSLSIRCEAATVASWAAVLGAQWGYLLEL